MNYPLIAFVVIVVIALIVFIIKQNIKDEKDVEREITNSELKPEKHHRNPPKL